MKRGNGREKYLFIIKHVCISFYNCHIYFLHFFNVQKHAYGIKKLYMQYFCRMWPPVRYCIHTQEIKWDLMSIQCVCKFVPLARQGVCWDNILGLQSILVALFSFLQTVSYKGSLLKGELKSPLLTRPSISDTCDFFS